MPKTKSKSKKTSSSARPRLDAAEVRQAAAGRWARDILPTVAGLPPAILDGKHHPCPKCGGTDRFRLIDPEAGAVLCNQCFAQANGDGFAAVGWARNINFSQSLREVASHLGITANNGDGEDGSNANSAINPAEHLAFLPWSETLVQLWCRRKPPITPEAIRAAGGRLARYRGQFIVIAIPVWGRHLDRSEPAGWVVMNTAAQGLPRKAPDGRIEWLQKPKLTYGSQPGLIGDLGRLKTAAAVWKLEGVTDLLAWLSLTDAPADHAAMTNANGCGESPKKWMLDAIAGLDKARAIYVLHDADMPGQRGAVGHTQHGRHKTGWGEALAPLASECRNVELPYIVAETHGQDLRDWLTDGGDFAGLRDLADVGQVMMPAGISPIEAAEDPNRLARVNLERYAATTGGRALRHWRDEWFAWRNTSYHRITERELRAKIWASVKAEYDRLWQVDYDRYLARKEAGELEDGELPPMVRKLNNALVGNVLSATAGMTTISHHVEIGTWLPTKERRPYLAVQNGILDIEAAMADKDLDECLLPHSPDWFSEVSLPYGFDPKAQCPLWLNFLNYNLDGDIQRINHLQEWAGYLLLPDTGEQAFMILEGEGANGKSVYSAGIEAMVGSNNCSFVQLELFGDRFSKTQTLGKLVNICGDVGELDRVAEGTLKAFASGNTLFFDRKGIGGLSCTPTARLMMACNNRPHFSDRSEGIWRRMQLVPWLKTVPKDKRVRNMDKAWWWAKSGELPGILNWALIGLYRLREQGGFTETDLMREAIAEYQIETNSAKNFLRSFVERDPEGVISCRRLYTIYNLWARENGYKPFSEKQFGKEVKRQFPTSERHRTGPRGARRWSYLGIMIQEDADLPSQTDDEKEAF